ncbi:hypothetical protein GCM10009119_20660 [Algoriphagus jejuensis]|uniref:Uncharacterized protein n=1 Tax=Algoriphagus jejuensis TaxID=419934 RepID=A0ABP3YF33_9BACT
MVVSEGLGRNVKIGSLNIWNPVKLSDLPFREIHIFVGQNRGTLYEYEMFAATIRVWGGNSPVVKKKSRPN